MKKLRLIYLDVDGVLFTGGRWQISEQILKNLKKLVTESGSEIVISSSFRLRNWDKLRDSLNEMGVPSIIGCTPRAVENKAHAIFEDLNARGDVQFVVIDDACLDIPHLIRCDPSLGLTKSNAEEALAEFARQSIIEGQSSVPL